jgi:putative RNA 2'-phosphotransferase
VISIVDEGSGDGSRRFELEGSRIRARYGHSLAQLIHYDPCTPPPVLYHGASRDRLPSIHQEGLKPMERQYVHLSLERKTAIRIGARHDERPIVLTINAGDAHAAGVEFYQADAAIYLAKFIPPAFLISETQYPKHSTQSD